jgi:hypothetical protein
MSDYIQVYVGKSINNKLNRIHDELLKNNIKIDKFRLYDYVGKDINENEIIERFKKIKNKKILTVTNNPFWEIKW